MTGRSTTATEHPFDVEGQRTSTGEARMYQDGTEILRTTATSTDLNHSRGSTTVLADKPDLPDDRPGRVPIPRPAGWRQGHPTGDPSMTLWIRFTGGRDADTLSLPLLVDAAAPVVLELGVSGSATLQLTTHVRGRPTPGWLACRVATRYVVEGYHQEDFELWDTGCNLVAQARQLGLVLTS